MSGWTMPLHVGLRVGFDGGQFTITEIAGRRILLEQAGGEGVPAVRQVDVAMLLTHPSTRFGDAAPQPRPSAAAVLKALSREEEDEVTARFRHVQEVRTGFRLGSAELAGEGEPRPEYAPGVPMMRRYAAKAAELGVDPATVRRWVARAEKDGPAGLVRRGGGTGVLGRVDPRWLDMARSVLGRHVKGPRPVRALVLIEIEERLKREFGAGEVKCPGRTVGYEALTELSRGTNAFSGSTKGKRSIADRPKGVLGRLRATRPGEYVVLDTTPLDVFAMEPVTCRWVQCELTVAMDLYSRCITGLRLTPVSTKAVDVAAVLLETVRPNVKAKAGQLPYAGVPSTVVLDAEKLVDAHGQLLLPSVATETIIFDHGRAYVSNHVESVCARMEISLQPARLKTPADKPVERWFRTLGEGLLAALPGYKGPDVHSRGEDAEGDAFYFLEELEAIVREWICEVYHCRPHDGLAVPEIPGLKVSPLEMFAQGLKRSGTALRVPARPDLALEFLDVTHTSIQHYGVDVHGLRYDGEGLNGYRNQRSPVRGKHAGRWPIATDPDDIATAWFQDPKTSAWHPLKWEHAPALNGPFSLEAAQYVRHLAADTHRFPDFRRAMAELLERWGAGLAGDRTERRMALRLSSERLQMVGEEERAGLGLERLPTLRRLTALAQEEEAPPEPEPKGGDDDEDAEVGAAFQGEAPQQDAVDEDAFYAGVWESR